MRRAHRIGDEELALVARDVLRVVELLLLLARLDDVAAPPHGRVLRDLLQRVGGEGDERRSAVLDLRIRPAAAAAAPMPSDVVLSLAPLERVAKAAPPSSSPNASS